MDYKEKPQVKLGELVTETTSKEQFEQLIREHLSPELKEALGENAEEKIRDALLYLAPFAPAPATMDQAALNAVWLPANETELNNLILGALESGVLKTSDVPKRYSIEGRTRQNLERIFKEYEK